VRLSSNDVSELILSLGAAMIAGSVLLAVLTAALRFGIKPLLADWSRGRAPPGEVGLAQRVAELEEEVRRTRVVAKLQQPTEDIRSIGRPRSY
jgi:hypothetical protein